LRQPDAMYSQKLRTDTCKRLKGVEESEVKFMEKSSSVGFLLCLQADGKQILLQCSPDAYRHPPDDGVILRVKHNGTWNSGILRSPVFAGTRFDRTWEDIVNQWKERRKSRT